MWRRVYLEARNRNYCFWIGLDVFANSVLTVFVGGTAYTTISARIGMSILNNGWANDVHWPKRVRQHFLDAVFITLV